MDHRGNRAGAGGRFARDSRTPPSAGPDVVRDGDRVIAETQRSIVLYESGFAPRWYVPRDDIDQSALVPVEGQTFCPYKGLASYYDIGQHKRAAWSYLEAWPEVARVSGFVSFEPDVVDVYLDSRKLALEPGQAVLPHGLDRGLDPDEVRQRSAVRLDQLSEDLKHGT